MPEYRPYDLGELVHTQQATAVVLERITARLESLEHWRDTEERRQDRAEERREERTDKAPDQQRANLALLVSSCSVLIYLLTFISQHWH